MDTISRQAAIDEANAWLLDCFGVQKQDRSCGLIRRLEDLPSAQPEIIRCKDCRYGDTFHEFDDPEMPMKCIGHHYGGTYPDDYCSYAERRTDG